MKVRNSGMPSEEMWDSFFNPTEILKKLKLNKEVNDVVEFGSGYGTFSLTAASLINGTLYAIDIEKEMIDLLQVKIKEKNVSNIKVVLRDFVKEGTGLEDKSADYVMMFNILHAEQPEKLLSEAYRVLQSGGKIGVIHWIYSADTPRGPSLDMRPTPQQCIEWLIDAGFIVENEATDLPPYHYGIVGIKEN